MSRAETRALGSLVIAGIALWFLQMRFLDGWQVVALPPRHMIATYLFVVIGMAIGETVLSGATAAGRELEDERDQHITRRAELISHWFLVAVVNILVVQLILQHTYTSSVFAPLAIVSTSGVVFTLLALLFAAHIVKMIATLVLYRL